MNIEEIRDVVTRACEEFDVRRLDMYGSAARGTNVPTSDVDLLVEFREPDIQPAKRFFGLLHQLEDTLNCEVDLLTTGSLRNPHFRKVVLAERVPIYEG